MIHDFVDASWSIARGLVALAIILAVLYVFVAWIVVPVGRALACWYVLVRIDRMQTERDRLPRQSPQRAPLEEKIARSVETYRRLRLR